MKKKIISVVLAAAMVMGIASCTSDPASVKKDKYLVGICQLVQHEALDAATSGFKQALIDKLGAEHVENAGLAVVSERLLPEYLAESPESGQNSFVVVVVFLFHHVPFLSLRFLFLGTLTIIHGSPSFVKVPSKFL